MCGSLLYAIYLYMVQLYILHQLLVPVQPAPDCSTSKIHLQNTFAVGCIIAPSISTHQDWLRKLFIQQ